MKAFINIIFPLLIAGSSCKKFLAVQPEQQVDASVAIYDAGSAEAAVNGLYNRLGSDGYYGSNYISLSYLMGGDIQWTGSQSAPAQIVARQLTADNSNIASAWTAIYRTILSANYIIDVLPGINDASFSQAKKDQFLGEAYFVRALAYFDLARAWGGVQLIVKPTYAPKDQEGIRRSSLAETYALVTSDLDKAETLLPTSVNRNRATQKTVWALKARLYLYLKDWSKAASNASKLVDDAANYKLPKPYNAFFANNTAATTEAIFELAYSNAFKNNHYNWWLPPALGGRREWAPNNNLVSLLNSTVTGGNRNAVLAQTAPPGNLWYAKLYYRNPTGTDPAYIIRLAELYFIRAEARAQQGLLSEALQDLNAVRDRAGLTALSLNTADEILLAIENERRLEFAFEGDRWFNLVRSGRAQTVLNVNDANKLVFPIPSSEILADDFLEPNPGY